MTNITGFTFLSTDGKTQLHGMRWEPEGRSVRAVLQICHGVAEHIARYDAFARYLNELGIAVVGHDHLGHGGSLPEGGTPVYFGEGNTWHTVVDDIYVLHQRIRLWYPDVPLCIMGHSMGSFIARNYTAKYNDVQAAIFCGTSGKNPAAPIAIKLASFVGKSRGSRHKSEFINNLAFGNYNKKFDNVKTEFDWLTRDENEVQKYIDDKYCGFLFSAAGYKDLFSVLNSVSGKDWYEQLSTDIPVLVVSGSMDPVGDYSKGVTQVAEDLKATGHDVTLKLFDGDRHEILNETNRDEVEDYIAAWADAALENGAKKAE